MFGFLCQVAIIYKYFYLLWQDNPACNQFDADIKSPIFSIFNIIE